MQIDRNESELRQIQYKLDSISSETDELRLKLEDIGRLAQPYEAQMDAIRLSYPELILAPDIFVVYEGLSAEWNRLNDVRNEIVGDLNDLVQSHNRTVAEFNWLAEEANALLEDLAWFP